MNACPCGRPLTYDACCGLIHGGVPPRTAEDLMRARYSAFVKGEIDFILNTVHPDKRGDHNRESIERWSRQSRWRGLDVLETKRGGPDDDMGMVEFVAHFEEGGGEQRHHEAAQFRRYDDRWFFYDGGMVKRQIRREGSKVGRNDPCPCGSGKKYKKCCA